MKLAVFSDIHSNYSALKTCVDYGVKQGAQQFIFLGDYISDCAYPQKTMDLIYRLKKEYPCSFIKGNREEYMEQQRSGQGSPWEWNSQSGSLLYTYSQLREEDFSFFGALGITAGLSIPGHSHIRLCHGSPAKSRDFLSKGSEATALWAKSIEEDYVLCGHSHLQWDFMENGKRFINYATVGSPIGNDPRASMGILESEGRQWNSCTVLLEYPIGDELAAIEESGLAQKGRKWTAAVAMQLQDGINHPLNRVERVQEMAKEQGFMGKLPESLWEEAARELGICREEMC